MRLKLRLSQLLNTEHLDSELESQSGLSAKIFVFIASFKGFFHQANKHIFVHQAVEISGALHVTARLKASNFQLFLATAED